MATKNVDPRRDIWGALIAESEETKTELGGNDSHFLFIGGMKSGKSSLQNAFFNRTDEPRPTLALSYQREDFAEELRNLAGPDAAAAKKASDNFNKE